MTTIWLGPIFKQREGEDHSYHGYGIQHFLDVDPHFGNLEDLKDFVAEAHRRGMYILLDIIINHTGDNWYYPFPPPPPPPQKKHSLTQYFLLNI